MSQTVLSPVENSFCDEKPRPPKLILASLCTKGLPQQTLYLPTTPDSSGSMDLTIPSRPNSANQNDFTSIISRTTSPSLSRSSRRFILCSEFILQDSHSLKQKRALLQLHNSSLSLETSSRPSSEKEGKPKKVGKERVKLDQAYSKSLLQRKPRSNPSFTPEYIAHRILLRLHDLNHNEALELAASIPEDKIKCSRLVPYWKAVFRGAILTGCESIPVLLLDKGLSISPNEAVYPQDPKLGFLSPDYFITSCALGLNKVACAMIKKALVNKAWMGITPLMYASAQGNSVLVQILLENGASPYYNVPVKHLRVWRKAIYSFGGSSSSESFGSNRTSLGSFSKYFDSDNSLVTINSNIESYPVFSLDFASGSLSSSAAQHLVSSMNSSSLKDNKFSLLLQQSSIISGILLKGGIDPNQTDGVGNSPFHLATISGRLDLVELLLQYGADINLCGIRQYTALHFAVKFQKPRIALALVCLGANRQAKDCDGQTPEELGTQCGLDHTTLLGYFDTSNLSTQKLLNCFSDSLAPHKPKRTGFFSPTFLRKWVSLKKGKRESFQHKPRCLSTTLVPCISSTDISSTGLKLEAPSMVRSYSTGTKASRTWPNINPKSAGTSLRDKLVTLVSKTR